MLRSKRARPTLDIASRRRTPPPPPTSRGLIASVSLAALVALSASLPAGAVQSFPRENFDARIALRKAVQAAPQPHQLSEVARLQWLIPELAVTFDSATGVTRTLGAKVGYLTGPIDSDPLSIALDFVAANSDLLGLSPRDLDDMEATNVVVSRTTGTTHFYFRQRAHGLPLYTGELQLHVGADGHILRVSNQFLANLAASINTTRPQLTVEVATRLAGASLGLSDRQAEEASRSPGELMLLALGRGEARLVWNFQLETPDRQHYYDFNVDAVTGEIWTRFDWVHNASQYRVFAQPVESPECNGRTLEFDPEHPTASQLGWFNDGAGEVRNMQGNNVHAYPDLFDIDSPAVEFICDLSGDHICDSPLDLNLEPDTYTAATTNNLFYWTNLIHDVQYLYGFDEAAGNFQHDNFGNGGVGLDRLDAESQDAGTDIFGNPILCNANMLTLPDGASPRMQTFICNLSTPSRDAALDDAVIVHEYGHGISLRQIGGPATTACLSNLQQMGEGISDWLAMAYTAEVGDLDTDARGIGSYLFGQTCNGVGIRSAPYSTDFAVNSFTYADINSQSVPHGVGFVWATAAWEVYWELVNLHGFDADIYNAFGGAGNQRAMLYHNEALQTVNCHPTFIDLRDAMIASAQASDPADVCPMWEAFARRGLGDGATTVGQDDLNPTEDFSVPISCADFTLMQPAPGTAGVINDFDFIGATPSADVYVVFGTAAGTTNVPIPGCGLVTVDVAGTVKETGTSPADAVGAGVISRLIPAGQAGLTRAFQAVDGATCTTSNRVIETF